MSDKKWCAWCGKWGDHTSGCCPDLKAHNHGLSKNEHAIFELSRALKDCIQLFIDADNAPDHKSLICTGDRREMWEEVLKKYGQ